MKIKNILRTLCFLLALFSVPPGSAAGQKPTGQMTSYTVQPGETLLGIAHRHGTTLDNMLRLNPGINADYVQAGQSLTVPVAKAVSVQQDSRGKNPVLIFDEWQPVITYKEYKVKRKDTAYSLAKANNITVDELMNANPAMRTDGYKLKKGSVVRIPVKTYPPKPQYKGLSTIRVAVVLPFVGNGVENVRSVEFYRGMLMGIDELKKTGKNVIVNAYNEPEPAMSVARLVNEVTAQKPDVIVGPLYPTHFNDVTAVADRQRKVAVPFYSNVPQVGHKDNVYVVNTPSSCEAELQANLIIQSFNRSHTIIFLSTQEAGKKSFCATLESQLAGKNYNVFHAGIASSAAQIKASLNNPAKGNFILIADDDSETALKKMFETARQLRTLLPGCKISVVGYENCVALSEKGWKNQLHEADTYVLASNYYFPYTSSALTFDTLYRQWFKTPLLESKPRMAPLGYDFALAFLGGLASYGYDYGVQPPLSGSVAGRTKLQTDLRFARVKGGGFVSRGMWLVHFKEDMSIVKLSAQ